MNHVSTTATAVQKLKRLAKVRRKTTGESLAAALDATAQEHGYFHWKHVTQCMEASAAAKPSPIALPEVIQNFLLEEQRSNPPADATKQAMSSGLVFAMDIKEADNERPEHEPDIQACDDALPFLAGSIWLGVLRNEQLEGVEEEPEPEEQVREFIDYVGSYRFVRYSGFKTFETLDDVFGGPFRSFFSPPTHVWLGGKFYDMGDVRQIKVDGQVIYSSAPPTLGRPGFRSYRRPAAPAQTSSSAPAPSTPPPAKNSPLREDSVVARLDVRKLQPGLYEFHVSHLGQEVFSDAGFSSIADALRTAAEVTGAIRGFEVAYAGLVAGTYGVEELGRTADAVAQRAVDLAASLGRV